MKHKELVALATKIAKLTALQERETDKSLKLQYETQIMELCGKVHSLDDMMAIDDLVQDLLSKYLEN